MMRGTRFPGAQDPVPEREEPESASATRAAGDAHWAMDAQALDIFLHVPCGIYTTTRDGRVVRANPAFARLLGHEPDSLRPALTIAAFYLHPTDQDNLWAAARRRGCRAVHEVAWRTHDGRPLTVRVAGRIFVDDVTGEDCLDVYVEDVTEVRRVEAEMHHAQKMEGIGRLAAEIAHDFNNLLTTILGYTDLLLEQIDADKPMHGDLREIQVAGQRAAALTKQLLAYSRQQTQPHVAVDLQEVMRTVEPMLRRALGDRVTLLLRGTAADLRVHAGRGPLIQVLMNLATNGRDAMPDGGTLTISAELVRDPDPPPALSASRGTAGAYVRLSVTDTGTGMDTATRARLFEPFFSTKAWGHGTGLGLTIVDGIVRPMGGWITITTAPQQGTTFDVYLPATDDAVHADTPDTHEAAEMGRETVLVVDDDPGVLSLAAKTLARHGYCVLTAGSADAAVELVATATTPIRVVVTDVVMPGITGPLLMARLRSHGCTRVVYMSGYAAPDVDLSPAAGEAAFLAKPFTPRALLSCVRQVMKVEPALEPPATTAPDARANEVGSDA